MLTAVTNPKLTTDLDDDSGVPYFLWDESMTLAELRKRLSNGQYEERFRLLGKIMREAKDTDVWKFTTPGEVLRNFDKLSKYLGRRRAFWDFLINAWKREDLIA